LYVIFMKNLFSEFFLKISFPAVFSSKFSFLQSNLDKVRLDIVRTLI
jgi:hypothetical protein